MPTPTEEILKKITSMSSSLSEEEKKKLKNSYFARLAESDPQKFEKLFNYDSSHYGNNSPLSQFENFRRALTNSNAKTNPLPIINNGSSSIEESNTPVATNGYQWANDPVVPAHTLSGTNPYNPYNKGKDIYKEESYEDVWKSTGFEDDEDIRNLYNNAYKKTDKVLTSQYKRLIGLDEDDDTPADFAQLDRLGKADAVRNRTLLNRTKLAAKRNGLDLSTFVGVDTEEEAKNFISNLNDDSKDLYNLFLGVSLKLTNSETSQDENYYNTLKSDMHNNKIWGQTYNSTYQMLKDARDSDSEEKKNYYKTTLENFKNTCKDISPMYSIYNGTDKIDTSDDKMLERLAEYVTNSTLFQQYGADTMLHSDFIDEVTKNESWWEKGMKTGVNMYNQMIGTIYGVGGVVEGVLTTLNRGLNPWSEGFKDWHVLDQMAEDIVFNELTAAGSEAFRGNTAFGNSINNLTYGKAVVEAAKEYGIDVNQQLGDSWVNVPLDIISTYGPTVASMIATAGGTGVVNLASKGVTNTLGKANLNALSRDIAKRRFVLASARTGLSRAGLRLATHLKGFTIPWMVAQGETAINAYENYNQAILDNIAILNSNAEALATQELDKMSIVSSNGTKTPYIDKEMINAAKDILREPYAENGVDVDNPEMEGIIRQMIINNTDGIRTEAYMNTEAFAKEVAKAEEDAKRAMYTDFYIESTFNGIMGTALSRAWHSPVVRSNINKAKNTLFGSRAIKQEMNGITTILDEATGTWKAQAKELTRWNLLWDKTKTAFNEGLEEWGQDVIGSFSTAISGYTYSNYLYNKLNGSSDEDALNLDWQTCILGALNSSMETALSKEALIDGAMGMSSAIVGGFSPLKNVRRRIEGDKDVYKGFKDKSGWGKTKDIVGSFMGFDFGLAPVFKGKEYFTKINAERQKVAERMNLFFSADNEAREQMQDIYAVTNAMKQFNDASLLDDEKKQRDTRNELTLSALMTLNHLEDAQGKKRSRRNGSYYANMMQVLNERANIDLNDENSWSNAVDEYFQKGQIAGAQYTEEEQQNQELRRKIAQDIKSSAQEMLELKKQLRDEQKKARKQYGSKIEDPDVLDAIAYENVMASKTEKRYNTLRDELDHNSVRKELANSKSEDDVERASLSRDDRVSVALLGNFKALQGQSASLDSFIKDSDSTIATLEEKLKDKNLSDNDRTTGQALLNELKQRRNIASVRKEKVDKAVKKLSNKVIKKENTVDDFLTAEEILDLNDSDRAKMIYNINTKYKDSEGKEHHVYSKRQRDEVQRLIDAGNTVRKRDGKKQDENYKQDIIDLGRLKDDADGYKAAAYMRQANPEALEKLTQQTKFDRAVKGYQSAFAYLKAISTKEEDYEKFKEALDTIVASNDTEKLMAITRMFEQDDSYNRNWEEYKDNLKNYNQMMGILSKSSAFKRASEKLQVDLQNILMFDSLTIDENGSIENRVKDVLYDSYEKEKLFNSIINTIDEEDDYNLKSLESNEEKIERLEERFNEEHVNNLIELAKELDKMLELDAKKKSSITPSTTAPESNTPKETPIPVEEPKKPVINEYIEKRPYIKDNPDSKVYEYVNNLYNLMQEKKIPQGLFEGILNSLDEVQSNKDYASKINFIADTLNDAINEYTIEEGDTEVIPKFFTLVNLNKNKYGLNSVERKCWEVMYNALTTTQCSDAVSGKNSESIKITKPSEATARLERMIQYTAIQKKAITDNEKSLLQANNIALSNITALSNIDGPMKDYIEKYNMVSFLMQNGGMNGAINETTNLYFYYDKTLEDNVKKSYTASGNPYNANAKPIVILVKESEGKYNTKGVSERIEINGESYIPIGFLPTSIDATQKKEYIPSTDQIYGASTSLGIRELTHDYTESSLLTADGNPLVTHIVGSKIKINAPTPSSNPTNTMFNAMLSTLQISEDDPIVKRLLTENPETVLKDLAAIKEQNPDVDVDKYVELKKMLDFIRKNITFGDMQVGKDREGNFTVETVKNTTFMSLYNGMSQVHYKVGKTPILDTGLYVGDTFTTLGEYLSLMSINPSSVEDSVKNNPLISFLASKFNLGANIAALRKFAKDNNTIGTSEKTLAELGKQGVHFNFSDVVFGGYKYSVKLTTELNGNNIVLKSVELIAEPTTGSDFAPITLISNLLDFEDTNDNPDWDTANTRVALTFLKNLMYDGENPRLVNNLPVAVWNTTKVLNMKHINSPTINALVFGGALTFPYDNINYQITPPLIQNPFMVEEGKTVAITTANINKAKIEEEHKDPVGNNSDADPNQPTQSKPENTIPMSNPKSYEQKWHSAFDSIIEKSKKLKEYVDSERLGTSSNSGGVSYGVTTLLSEDTGIKDERTPLQSSIDLEIGNVADDLIRDLFSLESSKFWDELEKDYANPANSQTILRKIKSRFPALNTVNPFGFVKNLVDLRKYFRDNGYVVCSSEVLLAGTVPVKVKEQEETYEAYFKGFPDLIICKDGEYELIDVKTFSNENDLHTNAKYVGQLGIYKQLFEKLYGHKLSRIHVLPIQKAGQSLQEKVTTGNESGNNVIKVASKEVKVKYDKKTKKLTVKGKRVSFLSQDAQDTDQELHASLSSVSTKDNEHVTSTMGNKLFSYNMQEYVFKKVPRSAISDASAEEVAFFEGVNNFFKDAIDNGQTTLTDKEGNEVILDSNNIEAQTENFTDLDSLIDPLTGERKDMLDLNATTINTEEDADYKEVSEYFKKQGQELSLEDWNNAGLATQAALLEQARQCK